MNAKVRTLMIMTHRLGRLLSIAKKCFETKCQFEFKFYKNMTIYKYAQNVTEILVSTQTSKGLNSFTEPWPNPKIGSFFVNLKLLSNLPFSA